MAKRKVVKRKIKTVKLTPSTALNVKVPAGHVPLMAIDPENGAVIFPVEKAKMKEQSWVDWLLGRKS